jgi:peptide/nickel transport system substrate-binding protein
MKKLLFLTLSAIILASICMVSCSQSEQTTSSPTAKAPTTTAVQSTTAAPAATTTPVKTTTTLDPAKYGGTYKRSMAAGPTRPVGYPAEGAGDSWLWATPVLDRLLKVDRMGNLIPELAVSWTPAADGKSIAVGLRKGVKFHDGSDFNAAVAKWNMDLQIAAKNTTDWTSIEVVDDYTIRINVPQYKNTMLSNLGSGYTEMISKASFDKNGIEWARWNPVGTGPFTFVSYEKDAKMTFKKNPSFWEAGKPYLDGLVISIIADSTVRKLAFQKGDIQRLSSSGIDAQELQKAGYEIVTEPGGTFALVPDSKKSASPWANINVRLAASYALNREALAKALGYGFVQPAYQLYPSFTQTAIPNLVKYSFDLNKSKSLLKEAGFPNGFKSVVHPFSVIPTDYTTAVVNQLTEAGIVIDIDKCTAAKYTDYMYNGWDGLMNQAYNSYSNFATSSDYFLLLQFPSVKLPAGLKEGYEAAAFTKEIDPKLLQAIMQIIYDDVTVIPYVEESRIVFLRKGVHDPCTQTFPLMQYIDKEVWLEQSAR